MKMTQNLFSTEIVSFFLYSKDCHKRHFVEKYLLNFENFCYLERYDFLSNAFGKCIICILCINLFKISFEIQRLRERRSSKVIKYAVSVNTSPFGKSEALLGMHLCRLIMSKNIKPNSFANNHFP